MFHFICHAAKESHRSCSVGLEKKSWIREKHRLRRCAKHCEDKWQRGRECFYADDAPEGELFLQQGQGASSFFLSLFFRYFPVLSFSPQPGCRGSGSERSVSLNFHVFSPPGTHRMRRFQAIRRRKPRGAVCSCFFLLRQLELPLLARKPAAVLAHVIHGRRNFSAFQTFANFKNTLMWTLTNLWQFRTFSGIYDSLEILRTCCRNFASK